MSQKIHKVQRAGIYTAKIYKISRGSHDKIKIVLQRTKAPNPHREDLDRTHI